MPLYEVAVIEVTDKVVSTDKGTVSRKDESLLFGPIAICAVNEQAAIVAATSGVKIEGEKSNWQVLVRPFA